MIEIPELIVIRTKLARYLVGMKLIELKIHWHKYFKQAPDLIIQAAENSTVTEVRRVGKLIHLVLDNGHVLGIYLGEGAIPYLTPSNIRFESRVFEMGFGAGPRLVVDDLSGQSYLILNPDLATTDDPLHPSLTLDYLKKSIRAFKSSSIKAYMLTERKMRGIGSVYADEILWQIKVAPHSAPAKIPDAKLLELIDSIRTTLIVAAGKIEALTGPKELIAARYDFLNVHNTGKRYDPDGYLIQRIVIHRKRAYWTERQTVYS
nr:DNA-formamidopyrimidine glycosylase family protein [uncultured Dyadobacter sp.]